MLRIENPAPIPPTGACHPPSAPSLLVEQLARATRELRGLEAQGRRTDAVRAVIRSLRSTLLRVAKHGYAFHHDDSGFMVKCAPEGEIELRRGARKLPIRAQTLRKALATAGVDPEPGQVILADGELARRSIEESLLSYSLQEFRIREAKANLLRAAEELQATDLGV